MEEQREILGGLILGIRELLSDRRIGRFDTRERAVMGRLARFMAPHYRGWDIDTDHERRGDDPKYLDVLPNGEPGRKPIIPDIIVHELGTQHNLLVVELKLSDNANIALDLWKLSQMTRENGLYAYSVGAHIILNLDRRTVAHSIIFIGGAPHPELTDWFQGHFHQ
ncbi:hypothetical protein DTW90_11805 [Neorhizobium sp. P12A]|uniref:hypothetical protein n=1 Tax=Neorhizobium sp. P12A TaxID=2268027 RepID=UPI0011EBCA3A|nr:hypothetical protein [Neorhizobium sp. P12A]KAA0699981.1 hypothetical protein DTW90_11805 [Neorhizobium sp. P12A]